MRTSIVRTEIKRGAKRISKQDLKSRIFIEYLKRLAAEELAVEPNLDYDKSSWATLEQGIDAKEEWALNLYEVAVAALEQRRKNALKVKSPQAIILANLDDFKTEFMLILIAFRNFTVDELVAVSEIMANISIAESIVNSSCSNPNRHSVFMPMTDKQNSFN